jgi:hypothetical protein
MRGKILFDTHIINIEREENDYKCIKQKHKKCAGSFKQGKGAEKAGRIRG